MQSTIIKGFKLSPQQKHLWRLQQNVHGFPYRTQCALLIEGNLDKKILEAALQNIINRHGILRTTFQYLPGMLNPLQVVAENQILTIRNYDLTSFTPEEQETQIEALFQEVKQQPLNFEQGPLFYTTLVTLSQSRHILLINLPALCADAATLKILAHEISQAYADCTHNKELFNDRLQYAIVSQWLNELLEEKEAEIGKEYWCKQYIPALFTLNVPFENRSLEEKFEPQFFSLKIHLDLVKKINALVSRYKTSTSTFLLLCWQILLWRLTGQSDVTVATAYDGRTNEELRDLLGLLAKYLPVHCHLEEHLKFSELLGQVDEATHEAYEWQECFDWEQLSEKTETSNFFPFCFDFEEKSTEDFGVNLSVSIYRQYTCIDQFKLKLSCSQGVDSLIAEFHYNTNFFSTEEIKRLAVSFYSLLESAVAKPEAKIVELEILVHTEKQRLVAEFNNTKSDFPKDKSLQKLFEEQVVLTPNSVAISMEGQHLTYAELNERANQVAHYLVKLGVRAEVLVALCVERSLEMFIGLLGILKAGGAFLPLDPGYPKEWLCSVLDDAQPALLLTQQQLIKGLPKHRARTVLLDADREIIAYESKENPATKVISDSLCYIIYTSGSTGRPKGVMISQKAICNHIFWSQTFFPLTQTDKVLQKTPLSFDASVWEIFAPLLVGARLLIARPGGHQDSTYLIKLIADQKVTVVKLVPSLLRMLFESEELKFCKSLRNVFCGGEALPVALFRNFVTNLDASLHNLYGPTEACIDATFWTYRKEGCDRVIPIGRPISNTQIYILDSYLQPLPIGVGGELYIGGEGLARGYLNRLDLTAERFIPNPFSNQPGARLYKTGDLARYLPDGNIEFLGRLDDQVKIRGFRVEPGEIETMLIQHPQVRESVVTVREDQPGNKSLVAYIVPLQAVPTPSDLRDFLAERLPDYMVPAIFVTLEALPLTPSGKIDKRALPVPDESHRSSQALFVLPRTPTEEVLAAIWGDVLGLKQVGIHDNFFALGGDSILSLQIIARAQQAGLQFSPRQMFQHQTIAGLAAVASETISVQAQQEIVTGQVLLTPIQHWFFEQNLPYPNHFNQSVMLEVPLDWKWSLLEQVVQQLLVHHDALRLRFTPSDSGWQQVNEAPDETVPLMVIDLSELSSGIQQSTLEATAAQLQASLNFSTGPIVRVALFHLGGSKLDRLLLIVHHLAVDGISWRILLEDLAVAYQQLSEGKAVQLPPKTTAFKDWAFRLTKYSQSKAATQLDYWLTQFQVSSFTPLLVDYPFNKEANTEASAATISVALNAGQTRALLQEVPPVYNTQINDVLLTALVQSFAAWTGEHCLLVDLEGHGREELFEDISLSRTVGWFTTIFPVLLDLGEMAHPGEALKAVKEQLRCVPNRGISYGLLRYLSQDATTRSQLEGIPKPEVIFNYLGQFEQERSGASFLKLVQEPVGPMHNLQGRRSHLLEINSYVVDGCLQLDWTYSEKSHRRDTVERLAEGFIEALKSLIAHCQSPQAGGYTPSDFPLAKLDKQKFSKLNTVLNQIDSL